MTFRREMPQSVVIVRNDVGATATLRYKSKKFDKILSTSETDEESIYKIVESYVLGKNSYGKAKR